MKTPLKLIVALSAVIFLGAIAINIPEIRAQAANSPQSPVPVVVSPTPKQYKVIDITRLPSGNSQALAGNIEKGLNDMGAQGWDLVTASGSYLILKR